MELARKAGSITQSVVLWLHRVAWNRACDVVRRDHSHRQAEEAMAETWHTDREATWPDIIPFSPLPVRLNGSFRGHPRKANSLQ